MACCSGKCNFTFDEYQKQSFTTAKYPEKGTGSLFAMVYTVLGLGSESGELEGKFKKVIRDDNSQLTPEVRKKVIDEMSDILWYLSALSTELGIPLSEVAKINLEKLFDRKERGVIGGSGDER